MFREMRRNNQLLSPAETIQILNRGTSGVLAVAGDNGYPYAVPLSYVYHDNKIYFHSAVDGHKLDAIRGNEKASFCVIDQDQVVPEKYTSYFRSVIVFGRANVLDDEAKIKEALEILAIKYAPDHDQERRFKEIDKALNRIVVIELEIDHITGKEAIQLQRARGKD